MKFKLKILYSLTCYGQGEVQYFIGVQLDGSKHVEPVRNVIEEVAVKEGEELVQTLLSLNPLFQLL